MGFGQIRTGEDGDAAFAEFVVEGANRSLRRDRGVGDHHVDPVKEKVRQQILDLGLPAHQLY